VNDAFARAAFPDRSPIGRYVLGDGRRLEIVGVVGTAKSRTIGEDPRPAIYVPILTEYVAAQTPRGVTVVVKTTDAAARFVGPVRDAIRSADRSLAVFDVRTMESHLDDALIVPRLASMVSAIGACVGLAIATLGVYGIISFAVMRRRRELGIRLAVGAQPRQVVIMVLGQGIRLACIGTALGLLAALAVTRFAAGLLYGVSPADPITFAFVPAFLVVVALLACTMPARAAARLDPVEILRSE
jgi:ABC-type antimicrobial peptide transport system permease subunit